MNTKKYTRAFEKLWLQIKSDQQEIYNYLNYAGKTVAIRGDIDQQKVVFTIRNRFNNSKYKQITKANAWIVFQIVNKQQQNFRKEKERIYRLLNQLEHQAKRPNVVVKKTIKRRLISG